MTRRQNLVARKVKRQEKPVFLVARKVKRQENPVFEKEREEKSFFKMVPFLVGVLLTAFR